MLPPRRKPLVCEEHAIRAAAAQKVIPLLTHFHKAGGGIDAFNRKHKFQGIPGATRLTTRISGLFFRIAGTTANFKWCNNLPRGASRNRKSQMCERTSFVQTDFQASSV